MHHIAWILPAFAALIVAAMPAMFALGGLSEAPILLAFVLMGWAAQRGALFAALGLGLLLDCLAHLPLGSMMVPGVVLTLAVALLRPWLARAQLAMQFLVILVAVSACTVAQPHWYAAIDLPAASPNWVPALVAALLWLPFAVLLAPADTAIRSDAAF